MSYSYLILLLVAAYLNIRSDDWRGMALCVLVGVWVSALIPDQHFYFWCMGVEVIVAAGSLAIRCAASGPVFCLSIILLVAHFIGYEFDGYPPESPYHFVVTIAEHAELLACAIFSKSFLGRLRQCRQNKSRIG